MAVFSRLPLLELAVVVFFAEAGALAATSCVLY
jgi:hypothetical protein